MSLNVPPVTGKTPKQIAVELRQLLKGMLMPEAGMQLPVSAEGNLKRAASYRDTAAASAQAMSQLLEKITGDLEELDKIASLRKPSLVRKKRSEIAVKISSLAAYATKERRMRERSHEELLRATEKLKTTETPAGSDTLKRIYALVQGLPVTEGAPQGSLESTIRAIEAILKAHHGVDVLGGFDAVPVPEALPIVMMHYMPAPEAITEPGAVPASAEPGQFYFLSAGGSKILVTLVRDAVCQRWGDWPFLHPGDRDHLLAKYGVTNMGVTPWEAWNDGVCSPEVAFDILRCVRGAYSDFSITLRNTASEIDLCVAALKKKIVSPEHELSQTAF